MCSEFDILRKINKNIHASVSEASYVLVVKCISLPLVVKNISLPLAYCCLENVMPANLENSAVAIGLEKISFHSNDKECSNYRTVTLISHTSKIMLKILQARLQQYTNHELLDVEAGFRKGRGTRDQNDSICCQEAGGEGDDRG